MIRQEFVRLHGRLALFREQCAQEGYWENRWSKQDVGKVLSSYADGRLGEFEDVFTRFLPVDSPVLEAGCGVGQLVAALAARGYSVEGVDVAAATIARVQLAARDLNVRVADVYQLGVPDGTYGGYISIGLFEHDSDGPLRGLREARRVLHAGGVAFISVPYLNTERRRWLNNVREVEQPLLSDGLSFYQYYFSPAEFGQLLDEAGLQVRRVLFYAVYAGLTRDFPVGRWLAKRGFFAWHVHRRITRWCREAPHWARQRWAHMVMFVCEPKP